MSNAVAKIHAKVALHCLVVVGVLIQEVQALVCAWMVQIVVHLMQCAQHQDGTIPSVQVSRHTLVMALYCE